MSDKKQDFTGLPTSVEPIKLGSPSRSKRTKALAIGLCLGLLVTGGLANPGEMDGKTVSKPHPTALCPQVKPIAPTKHSAIWESFVERTATDEYKTRAIEWLGGAVRVPYVCYPSLAWNIILTVRSGPSRTITWTPWGWIHVGRYLDRSTIICCMLSLSCMWSPPVRISFLVIGLQSLHLVLNQSQHVGSGLRVVWV